MVIARFLFLLRRCPLLWLALLAGALTGCSASQSNEGEPAALRPLALPELQPAGLDGGRLQIVATTSIVGDVVGRVGGELIDLTVLIAPGQDPHSYEPSAADLTLVAAADLVIVNGWDLEESLVRRLGNVAGETPLAPISAGIIPLPAGQASGGDHPTGSTVQADPHVWLDPHLVRVWVDNAALLLSAADPANAAAYAANAAAYQVELDELIAYVDERVASLPAGRRKLVANHDNLAYFARAYDFEVVGAVIPAASTLSEPSAGRLAELAALMADQGVCALFAENTANPELAEAVAAELSGCVKGVRVVTLTTDALAAAGPASSYTGMMRANVDAIVEALE
jgi:ABC-type Zn uptake system ZnuABC Zn-binding protein ZnuA